MQAQSDTPSMDWRKGLALARQAPRCHARCKHSKLPCQNPAMRGRRVCRMHGGRAGAPRGIRNGRYSHGRYTIEEQGRRVKLRADLQAFNDLVKALDSSDDDPDALYEAMRLAGLL
jgi:hypothetical protein